MKVIIVLLILYLSQHDVGHQIRSAFKINEMLKAASGDYSQQRPEITRMKD